MQSGHITYLEDYSNWRGEAVLLISSNIYREIKNTLICWRFSVLSTTTKSFTFLGRASQKARQQRENCGCVSTSYVREQTYTPNPQVRWSLFSMPFKITQIACSSWTHGKLFKSLSRYLQNRSFQLRQNTDQNLDHIFCSLHTDLISLKQEIGCLWI